MVHEQGEYSVTGTILHSLGISAIPRLLRYRCVLCGDVVDETTDPNKLRGNIR